MSLAMNGQVYQGGKWIEITYGRPIKRGRDSLRRDRSQLWEDGQSRRACLARRRELHDAAED